MSRKKKIKEILEELGISMEEFLEDIQKQMNYTYSHRVNYKNYTIAQDENTEFNDVIILKDGKEIFHSSNGKQYTDEELKEYLLNVIQFAGDKENERI